MRIRDKIKQRMRSTSMFTILKSNQNVNMRNIKTNQKEREKQGSNHRRVKHSHQIVK